MKSHQPKRDLRGIKIRYNSYLLRVLTFGWAAGAVFYPYVLFKRAKDQVSPRLFRHELEHFYQMRSIGPWRYYWAYLREWLVYGHKLNMFEILACEAQDLPFSAAEWRLWQNTDVRGA